MDRNLLEKQLGHIDRELLYDLKTELSAELGKPENERDEELITELRNSISGTREGIIEQSRKRSLDSVLRLAEEYEKPKHIAMKRCLAAIAACTAVFIGLNAASMQVLGMNTFSAAYQLYRGGLIVPDSADKTGPTIEISPDDPYKIKKLYAKYGVGFPAPMYLPEGAEFDNWSVADSDSVIREIRYSFRIGSGKISLISKSRIDSPEPPPLDIPTDTFDVEEKKIGGKTVYILNTGTTFSAYFVNGSVLCELCTENLDLSESEKILESMIYQR